MNNASESAVGPQAAGDARVTWGDPSIPAGDAPPLPNWPVYVSGILWAAWIVYLAFLAATR